MKFLTPNLLKSGMRLARPIYNKRGVLLYERGLVLTDAIIKNIENFSLIGIFILEPAEPLAPVTKEEQEFEQLQTTYLFRLRESMVAISKGNFPQDFALLVREIVTKFAHLENRFPFVQVLRSNEDYIYKHSICTAILCAMISQRLSLPDESIEPLVAAALLADFGYLYVPKEIMSKRPQDYSNIDLVTIEQYRKRAYELLHPSENPYRLSTDTLRILSESLAISRQENLALDVTTWSLSTKILLVADRYDLMTAMSLRHEPDSSIVAMNHLQKNKTVYEGYIVDALLSALALLPAGQCVELNNNRSAMVVSANDADVMHPVVYDFSTQTTMDLSEPKLRYVMKITDLMQSMDKRYICDEDTVKQFVPDEALQKTTRRVRMRLAAAKKRDQNRYRR